jgi:hypothetical protein
MNMFEGSRRIALVAALVVSAAMLVDAATYAPSVRVSYLLSADGEGGAFKRLPGACPPQSTRESVSQAEDDVSVFIEVCFLEKGDVEEHPAFAPGHEKADTPPSRLAYDYAAWIVQNEDKKGTAEFETVAKAYEAAKQQEQARAKAIAIENAKLRLIYRRKIAAGFSIPEHDKKWVRDEASRQYWQHWRARLKLLGFCLLVFAASVLAVGWVVRGFLGIPRGLDRKPDPSH